MTLLKLWRSVLTLSVTWMFIASSALAQSTAPSPADSPTRTDGSASVAPASPTTDSGSSKVEPSKPAAKRTRSARATVSREQVTAVQQALKDKGHDPGEIDGAMGPKTRSALRDFQKKEGLKVTGRIDSTTMAKLGIGRATTAGSASRPGMEVKPVVGEPSSGAASPVSASETPPTSASPPAGEPKK